jgi:hypothetical protein
VPTPERRQDPHPSVSLPVRVEGHAPDGTPWEEETTYDDASDGGTSFPLRHLLIPGQVLRLSLPLPDNFRPLTAAEPSYRVYALVRSVRRWKTGKRVGVMFLGQRTPRSFERKPGGRYLPPDPSPPEDRDRRAHPRVDVFLNLRLRRVDPLGEGAVEEQAVAENLGAGGARVLATVALGRGEVVTIEEPKGAFRARAEIRNAFIGGDRIPRLNLAFLGGTPGELLRVAGLSSGP